MDEKIIQHLKFDEKGLIPAIVQDYSTNEVLMMAYMNREALEKTMETGMAHYWSRSRQKLWLKGETSGHFQAVKSMSIDCDGDTLLLRVEQKGSACHTGQRSCFYRELAGDGVCEPGEEVREAGERVREPEEKEVLEPGVDPRNKARILQEVYDVIVDRTINPKEGSYTNYLFEKGLDKMLKKVGEEAAEVIIAAKNRKRDEIRYEIADLLYHLLVVMVETGLKPDDIYDELKGRR